jgi:hypothetical protein
LVYRRYCRNIPWHNLPVLLVLIILKEENPVGRKLI